jgi:hypothetical protein
MAKYSLAYIFLFTAYSLQAQQYVADSSFVNNGIDYAKQLYFTQRGEESAIYKGIHHIGYPSSIEGHAYFRSPNWQKGSVLYDHVLYENIVMKYDLYKDQLIVTPQDQGRMSIGLFSPRVTRFSFSKFNFIRIDNSNEKTSPAPGFYLQLTYGKLTVLAKSTKIISDRIEERVFLQKFDETVKYYLLKDGIYYYVNNKKDILNVIKDKKKEVQQFLSKNKLNYRKNREHTLVAIAEFYNQSSH